MLWYEKFLKYAFFKDYGNTTYTSKTTFSDYLLLQAQNISRRILKDRVRVMMLNEGFLREGHIWVRSVHSHTGESKDIFGSPPALYQSEKESGYAACLEEIDIKMTQSMAQRGIRSGVVHDALGFKHAYAELGLGSYAVVTLRSPIMDPQQLWEVSEQIEVPYRSVSAMWHHVPIFQDEIISLVGSTFPTAQGFRSLKRLAAQYNRRDPAGGPELFSSDISHCSSLSSAYLYWHHQEQKFPSSFSMVVSNETGEVVRAYRFPSYTADLSHPPLILSFLKKDMAADSLPCDLFDAGLALSSRDFLAYHDMMPNANHHVRFYWKKDEVPPDTKLMELLGAASADYSGKSWLDYLQRQSFSKSIEELQQDLRLVVASLEFVNSTQDRALCSSVAQTLEVLLGVEQQKDPSKREKALAFLQEEGFHDMHTESLQHRYLSFLQQVYPNAELQIPSSPFPTVREVIEQEMVIPNNVNPLQMLSKYLDMLALIQDVHRDSSPITIRGYGGLRGNVARGYSTLPLPNEIEETLDFRGIKNWELQSEPLYVVLTESDTDEKILAFRAIVSSAVKPFFAKMLEDTTLAVTDVASTVR